MGNKRITGRIIAWIITLAVVMGEVMLPQLSFTAQAYDEEDSDDSEEGEYKVKFFVVNGYWNSGKSDPITIVKSGKEGEILKLDAADIPDVGAQPFEDFKEGSWDEVLEPNTVLDSEFTVYTYTYAPADVSVNVTLKVKNGSWDDGTKEDKTITVTGIKGNVHLTADQLPAVGSKPDENYHSGRWDNSFLAATQLEGGETVTYTYEKGFGLGTEAIMNPAIPGSFSAANFWGGSYVYFGSYQAESQTEAAPVKYRVLDQNTDKFGGHTMLLDCDTILFKSEFNPKEDENRDKWEGSVAYKALNTNEDSFLNTAFSSAEREAIANSTIASHAYTSDPMQTGAVVVDPTTVTKFQNYTALNGEKIFLLDIEDVSNTAYGYSSSYLLADTHRIKNTLTTDSAWRLRSPLITNSKFICHVTQLGKFYSQHTVNVRGMSPALNIDLSSVIKTTEVGSEPGAHKLMITDKGLGIALTENKVVTVSDGKITVPFTITDNSETAAPERVSVLVTNGIWGEDGWSKDAEILQYTTLDMDAFALSGEGAFDLDAGINGECGKDYHVYLIAEDINGAKETDYASAPLEISDKIVKQIISAEVTFKVVNGSWDDGKKDDIVVTLRGYEGNTLKLTANLIPAVGAMADDTFKAGAWDVVPSVDTVITENTTYTYTYAQKDPISAKVTFKVVNGSWNDGTKVDVIVTLTGYEGDTLKLTADQIPAVGIKADETFKAGTWDVTPAAGIITADTTYTYTYAQKDPISAKVTFKVVNGSWNDGTKDDVIVTLTGYEGDTLKLTTAQIPAVGNKADDTFKAGAWNTTPSSATAITDDTTYTYTYVKKNAISATVTFKVVNGAWNDGTKRDVVVTLTGYEGDTLKLTAAQIPAVGNKADDTFKAGSWDVTPSANTAITADKTYTYTYAEKPAPTAKPTTRPTATPTTRPTATPTARPTATPTTRPTATPTTRPTATPTARPTATPTTRPTATPTTRPTATPTTRPTATPTARPTATPTTRPTATPTPAPVVDVFEDIKAGSWYEKAIQYIFDHGIMKGKGTNFEPNATISREEVAQTLYNLKGKPEVDTSKGNNPFPDVKSGKWYVKAVLWAKENNIVSGNGNGTFGIGKSITREQLAQMLYKYAILCNYDVTKTDGASEGFKDSDKISSWAHKALDWAISQGIMSGKGKKDAPKSELSLDPLGSATRAECASMVMKFLQKNGQ